MISRYEAYMDGIALSSISANILIRDIQYQDAGVSLRRVALANRDGAIIDGKYIEKASVVISFDLREYDTVTRQTVLAKIIQWARGSVLRTSDRPDQQLVCICEKFPAVTSALMWTETLQIAFSAYAIPYWQSVDTVSAVLTGTNQNTKFYVPGSAEKTLVSVDITPSATVTSLTVTCGDTAITLSGISVASGSMIKFAYDGNGFLSIKNGNTSLLNKRTAASSDNLELPCGKSSTIRIVASASVTARFIARGWWL